MNEQNTQNNQTGNNYLVNVQEKYSIPATSFLTSEVDINPVLDTFQGLISTVKNLGLSGSVVFLGGWIFFHNQSAFAYWLLAFWLGALFFWCYQSSKLWMFFLFLFFMSFPIVVNLARGN